MGSILTVEKVFSAWDVEPASQVATPLSMNDSKKTGAKARHLNALR